MDNFRKLDLSRIRQKATSNLWWSNQIFQSCPPLRTKDIQIFSKPFLQINERINLILNHKKVKLKFQMLETILQRTIHNKVALREIRIKIF